MEYNVIWIDDEWDTRGASFIETCKLRHQIYISAYKTRKEGIAALERNLKHWDAVILDAKAYNNSTDCEVTDDTFHSLCLLVNQIYLIIECLRNRLESSTKKTWKAKNN